MTSPVAYACVACGQQDHDPKVHLLLGRSAFTPSRLPDWTHFHHDCSDEFPAWHAELVGDGTGEGGRFLYVHQQAKAGLRGDALRAHIGDIFAAGVAPPGPTMMATAGIDVGVGNPLLDFLHPATGVGTAPTVTGPINLRAMATVGADDAHAGTEIATGNSYTAGGTGLGAPTWATAGTVGNVAQKSTNATLTKTNMPGCTINGLEEWSSDGTPKRVFWGQVASLVVTAGSTVAIASAALADVFA